MTYYVLSGTVNLAQLNSTIQNGRLGWLSLAFWCPLNDHQSISEHFRAMAL